MCAWKFCKSKIQIRYSYLICYILSARVELVSAVRAARASTRKICAELIENEKSMPLEAASAASAKLCRK